MRGKGGVYDQFDMLLYGQRRQQLSPIPVDVSKPQSLVLSGTPALKCLAERHAHHQLYFAGDLADLWHRMPDHAYVLEAMRLEGRLRQDGGGLRGWFRQAWYSFVARPYTIALEMMLEKASR